MSVESYIMIGDKRIPVQVEYSPILTDPPVTLNFNRSLADFTFQASGTLTPAGMEQLGQLLWDNSPPFLYYYPVVKNMSETPINVSIDTSGLEHALKQLRCIRASLSHLEALANRSHRSNHRAKLRKRRKHRAMFRRKKRGLA